MIRQTVIEDIEKVMSIYNHAKQFMIDTGNPKQWSGNYLTLELIKEDIKRNISYVYEVDGEIHGVFVFIIGEDPTYKVIDGKWKSDMLYGTIHRIAGDGKVKGVFKECINFCKEQIAHLRIDTHKDNKIMRHLILKNKFEYSGIIYLANGSERLAYDWLL